MSATIKIGNNRSYQLNLTQAEQVQSPRRNPVLQLAIRIIYAIGLMFYHAGAYIDRGFTHINLEINALPLRYARVQSIALNALNHSYSAGTIEEKRALESYICQILEQKAPHLNVAQRQQLARHIAQDPKVYDIGGLCLGYSWMFALYVLNHRGQNIPAAELKNDFLRDDATRLIPVVSFAAHVDVSQFIQVDNTQVTILGNAVRKDGCNTERYQVAVQAIKQLAYPTMKLEHVSVGKVTKDKIEDYRTYVSAIRGQTPDTVEEGHAMIATIKQKYESVMSCNKILEKKNNLTLELDEEIKLLGKHYDGSAFVFDIQTGQGPGHAMTIYCSEAENKFLFFDSNMGVTSFSSLDDLATGVKNFVQRNYGTNKAASCNKITL